MLVSDCEPDRARMAVSLRRLGYRVIESRHGGHALVNGLQSPRIHVLIADATMRCTSADELRRDMETLHPGLKLLLVDEDARVAADASLLRPFTPNLLAWKVRELLESQD